MNMTKIVIKSAREMANFSARAAGDVLAAPSQSGAVVLALAGDLGAGKTTFVQGFARALGIKSRIISPTFLILKRYALRASRFANLYHIDAYRLNSPKELLDLDFKKIISDPRNIVLIEWADKIKNLLPRDIILIKFNHGKTTNERIIEVN